MTGGLVGAGLGVAWSLFGTVGRDQWMFGHLVPAVAGAIFGGVLGFVLGALVGLLRPRPRGGAR